MRSASAIACAGGAKSKSTVSPLNEKSPRRSGSPISMLLTLCDFHGVAPISHAPSNCSDGPAAGRIAAVTELLGQQEIIKSKAFGNSICGDDRLKAGKFVL